MPDRGTATHRALAGISAGDPGSLRESLGLWGPEPEGSGLDARTAALVGVGALIALDAPPAAYAWQVSEALEAGVTADEVLAVLRLLAPQIGAAKSIAAAPELMLALGLDLPARPGEPLDAS